MARRRSLAVWYYRDAQQVEVDFVLTGGGHGEVVEAKWAEHADARDARGVRELLATARARGSKELAHARGWVVCRTVEPHPLAGEGPRVEAVSLPGFIARLGEGG